MGGVSPVDLNPARDDPGRVTLGSTLSRDLREAVPRGELTAVYQPQFDLATGTVVSLETLCRWDHPRHGLLRPDAFIEIAEREGLIADLGAAMLDLGGRELQRWRREGREIELAVNASPSEIVDGFAARVIERVASLGLPRGALTVEITESPPLTVLPVVLEALRALDASGVAVSIDDFGSGNTSLTLLDRLTLSEVKIDRSLIQHESRSSDAQIEACLELAAERGWRVVAEGIETPAQLERAHRFGFHRAQGYLLGMPMTADEIDALFAEGGTIPDSAVGEPG